MPFSEDLLPLSLPEQPDRRQE